MKKLIRVPLRNPRYEGFIVKPISGGGKHQLNNVTNAQLEGFVLSRQKAREFNSYTSRWEDAEWVTKHTVFWTEEGYSYGGEEGQELLCEIDLTAVKQYFAPGCKKQRMARRICDFLDQPGIEVLYAPTQPCHIDPKFINGRPLRLQILPDVPYPLHSVGKRLITSRFLFDRTKHTRQVTPADLINPRPSPADPRQMVLFCH